MHESVGRIDVECLAGCTDVALLVAVDHQLVVKHCHQHIAPDVELTAVVEQRNQIPLQQQALMTLPFLREALSFGLQPLLELRKGLGRGVSSNDASASIGVLCRFDDPMLL